MRTEHSALTHGFGLTLVLLAIPLAVAAGTLAVPNTFTNGTVADADEVNANFGSVKAAVDDNDSRITAAQATADAAAAGHTVDTDTQLTSAQVAAAATAGLQRHAAGRPADCAQHCQRVPARPGLA